MKFFTITLVYLLFALTACNSSKKTTDSSEIITSPVTETSSDLNNSESENVDLKRSDAQTNTTEPDDVQVAGDNPMVGEYIWVKTICCGRKRNVTKATSDTDKVLKFSKDGKMTKIENNARVAERNYTYIKDGKIYKGRPQLHIDGIMQDALVRYEDGMLVLDYQYMDLQLEYYKKVE